MIELLRTRLARPCLIALTAVAALLLPSAAPVAASDAGTLLPAGLSRLADALADSIDAITARETVMVTDVRENGIRIDRGAAAGLRPYSRLTLLPADLPPWTAEIADLEDAAAWLRPVDPDRAAPPAGTEARIRVDLSRIAVDRITASGDGAHRWADAWLDQLADRLQSRAALATIVMPAYPDTSEWRESARQAGGDAGVLLSLTESAGKWTATAQAASLRRARTIGTTRATVRAPSATGPKSAPPDWPLEPPPGLLAPMSVAHLDGA
ncbi:MAG TPA: hypothetical protein VF720_11960, partial [Candidatus Eisenbacteria bacterium]